jgi:hypothetical protein
MENDIEKIEYEIGELENKHIFQLASLRLLDEAVENQPRFHCGRVIKSDSFSTRRRIRDFFL